MKKHLVVLSALVLAFGMAHAASIKTSKARALTSAQMQSVKGQGYFYVWVWVTPQSYNANANQLLVGTGDPDNPDSTTNATVYPAAGGVLTTGPGMYVEGAGSGPCSFNGYIYIGGPLAGQSVTQ